MGDPEGTVRDGGAPAHAMASERRATHARVSNPPEAAGGPTFGGEMERPFRELMDEAPVAAFVKDPLGRYVYANPYLLATLGRRMGPEWRGKTDADMWPPDGAAMIHERDQAIHSGKGPQIFSRVMPLDDGPHTVLLIEFPLPTGHSSFGVGGIGIDLTYHMSTEASRDQLASAVDQAAESVMLVDLDGRITYVNPAFERVTGYSRAEVLGKNPRLLQSGLQTSWFYDAMWAAISRGLPWVADLVNRRKDGSTFTEEAVISPIVDASGKVTSYMAIKRDVTKERALEERSTRLAGERALVGETIRALSVVDTPETTAQAICRRVATLSHVTSAGLTVFELNGRASTIALAVPGETEPPLLSLTYQRSHYLIERATKGPWVEPWVDRPSHPYNQLLHRLGVRTTVYAPVRHRERTIGVLIAHSDTGSDALAATEILPAVVEFAELAGVAMGEALVRRAHMGRGSDRISSIILDGAFRPVFQPIVDLRTSAIVGYEALTRFTDGTSPDLMFAKAAEVGLGMELEIATLRASLGASAVLPKSAWLNVNASPDLILAGQPLGALIRDTHRRVVVEITEHTAIADYEAFRAAMAALGPKVELAVDDAGAGFAGLHHILELHAAFVKLDRWLVAGLESDSARQAMIVGLGHFAAETGCRLIAEGIETESELTVLRGLNIELGQGYLLGRPVPVEDARAQGRGRPARRKPVKQVARGESPSA